MNTFNQTSANVSLGKRQIKDTGKFHPIYFRATGIGNWYSQDLEYFEQPSFSCDSLPEKVQLEYCFKAKILSDYLLTFQNEHGYMKALTGLRKVLIPNWHYGDLRVYDDGRTITSLILVEFSPDKTLFRLYLLESYYPNGKKRIREILEIIRDLTAKGRPPHKVLKSITQGSTELLKSNHLTPENNEFPI